MAAFEAGYRDVRSLLKGAIADGTRTRLEHSLPKPGATPSTTEHPQDGPVGGCWLWWKGKRHHVPKGVCYSLIDYMWKRDFASYRDLEGAVFDGAMEEQTIRARCCDLNRELRKIGVPWKLSTDAKSQYVLKRDTAASDPSTPTSSSVASSGRTTRPRSQTRERKP